MELNRDYSLLVVWGTVVLREQPGHFAFYLDSHRLGNNFVTRPDRHFCKDFEEQLLVQTRACAGDSISQDAHAKPSLSSDLGTPTLARVRRCEGVEFTDSRIEELICKIPSEQAEAGTILHTFSLCVSIGKSCLASAIRNLSLAQANKGA
jgi:hypothetical protein